MLGASFIAPSYSCVTATTKGRVHRELNSVPCGVRGVQLTAALHPPLWHSAHMLSLLLLRRVSVALCSKAFLSNFSNCIGPCPTVTPARG